MAITRTHDVDDDGTGTTGTPRNAAWKEELYDQIDGAIASSDTPGVVTITNGGANVFDVVLPTPRPFYYVRVYTSTADITIRSLTPGRPGDVVLIEHIGHPSYPVWFTHGQTALPGWLQNRVTSGATPIAFGGSALYVWESFNYWGLAQHDQGKAIRVPYSAANFWAPTGSWTTTAGGTEQSYVLRQNHLFCRVGILNSVTNAANALLYVGGWPFGFVFQSSIAHVNPVIVNMPGAWQTNYGFPLGGGPPGAIQLFPSSGNWVTGSIPQIYFNMIVEVA